MILYTKLVGGKLLQYSLCELLRGGSIYTSIPTPVIESSYLALVWRDANTIYTMYNTHYKILNTKWKIQTIRYKMKRQKKKCEQQPNTKQDNLNLIYHQAFEKCSIISKFGQTSWNLTMHWLQNILCFRENSNFAFSGSAGCLKNTKYKFKVTQPVPWLVDACLSENSFGLFCQG